MNPIPAVGKSRLDKANRGRRVTLTIRWRGDDGLQSVDRAISVPCD